MRNFSGLFKVVSHLYRDIFDDTIIKVELTIIATIIVAFVILLIVA